MSQESDEYNSVFLLPVGGGVADPGGGAHGARPAASPGNARPEILQIFVVICRSNQITETKININNKILSEDSV